MQGNDVLQNPTLVGGKYHLQMKFNDKVFECDTDNLAEAIKSFRPIFLKTRILMNVRDNETGKVCEQQVFVQRGRMMFGNKVYLAAVINKLIFK